MDNFGTPVPISTAGQSEIFLTPTRAPVIIFSASETDNPLKMMVRHNDRWTTTTLDTGGSRPRGVLDAKGRMHVLYPRTFENQLRYGRFDTVNGWLRRWPERVVRATGMPTSHALAVNAQHDPVVAYYASGTNQVKLATWDGDSFVHEVVPVTANAGSGILLGLEPNGAPHLVYGESRKVVHAYKSGNTWMFEDVVTDVYGLGEPASDGRFAMAMDRNGQPVVAAIKSGVGLEVYRRTGANAWTSELAVTPSLQGGLLEAYVRVDSGNRPHLLYTCSACGNGQRALYYARHNGTAWETTFLQNEVVYPNFVLDSLDAPHFTFVDRVVLEQRYVHFPVSNVTNPTVSVQVNAATGGTVMSADGLTALDIPPGALAADTMITMRRVPSTEWTSLVAQQQPFTHVYELLPDGLAFATPAHLVSQFPVEAALSSLSAGIIGRSLTLISGGGAVENVAARTVYWDTGVTFEADVPHFTRAVAGDTESNRVTVESRPGIVNVPVPFYVTSEDIKDNIVSLTLAGPAVFDNGTTTKRVHFDGSTTLFFPPQVSITCTAPGTYRVHVDAARGDADVEDRCDLPQPPSWLVNQTPTLRDIIMRFQPNVADLPTKATQRTSTATDSGSGDRTDIQAVSAGMPILEQLDADLLNTELLITCGTQTVSLSTTCPLPNPLPFSAGEHLIVATKNRGPILQHENAITYTQHTIIQDNGPLYRLGVNNPNDPFVDGSLVLTTTCTNAIAPCATTLRRVNANRTSLSTVTNSNARVIMDGEYYVAIIPREEMLLNPGQLPEVRVATFGLTGSNGTPQANDFRSAVIPGITAPNPFLRIGSGSIEDIAPAELTYDVYYIAATDGILDPLATEATPALTFTTTGSVRPFVLGESHPNVFYEVLSDTTPDATCLVQDRGDATFVPVGSAGGKSKGRFKAHPNSPMGGCEVQLRAVCITADNTVCNVATQDGGVPPDHTIRLRVVRGGVDRFFIQTPGRICEDGEPSELLLGRWVYPTGTEIGMAADLYVCVHTTMGAWLRYDQFTDDHPGIVWSVPEPAGLPETNIQGGGQQGSFPFETDPEATGHGYIRNNLSPNATGTETTLTATGMGQSDTITVRSIPAPFNTQEGRITSVIGRWANMDHPSCTGIPGGGTAPQLCLMPGQIVQIDAFGIIDGVDHHVGTDSYNSINGTFLQGVPNTPSRAGIRAAYVTTSPILRDTFYVGAFSGPRTGYAMAIVRGPTTYSIATGPVTLAGTLDSEPLVSEAVVDVGGYLVTVHPTAWADTSMSRRGVVGAYQPWFFTGPAPAGFVAWRGDRYWGQLFAQPVTAARTVDLRSSITTPDGGITSAPVTWTVTP